MDINNTNIKLALGLNNCVDFEIHWDSSILEELIRQNNIYRKDIKLYTVVENLRQLICSLLYLIEAGEGIGSKITDMNIVFDYSNHFTFKKTLGGSGVRAAIAIRKFGYKSLLHLVSQSDDVRKLLPNDCEYFCAVDYDADYPHLIIQFPEGAEIHVNDIDIIAKRANRAMYFNDRGIMELPLSEDFFKAATTCNTMLIGGFTSISDPDLAKKQARKTVEYLNKYARNTVVYYEDSCPPGGIKPVHNEIWRIIVPKSQIYSMNEDELQLHIGAKINLLDANVVISAIEKLSKIIPCESYVIHSKYWAIVYGEHVNIYAEALQNAVDISTSRLVYGDEMTAEDLEQTRKRPMDPLGLEFKHQVEQGKWKHNISCIPSYLVTEKNLTTIGLGDSFVGGFLAKLSDILVTS